LTIYYILDAIYWFGLDTQYSFYSYFNEIGAIWKIS
jgi:hypothetical protein